MVQDSSHVSFPRPSDTKSILARIDVLPSSALPTVTCGGVRRGSTVLEEYPHKPKPRRCPPFLALTLSILLEDEFALLVVVLVLSSTTVLASLESETETEDGRERVASRSIGLRGCESGRE